MASCMAHAVFQALETLLLRSSAEATPFVPPIIQTGMQYIKYDPVRSFQCCHDTRIYRAKNYTEGDDDEDMVEADEEEEDEELDDESVETFSDTPSTDVFKGTPTTKTHHTRSAVLPPNSCHP